MDQRLHAILLKRLRAVLYILLCGVSLAAAAESLGERVQAMLGAGEGGEEYLHPDEAFRFNATVEGPATVLLAWDIAPGYYLYRDKFSFEAAPGGPVIDQAAIALPAGEVKEDEVFGRVKVNTGFVEIRVPLLREAGGELPLALTVGYQGCKDESICYPPIRSAVHLTLPAGGAAAAAVPAPGTAAATAQFGGTGWLATIATFFGLGLALSLTPCVFPMIPILSGIIAGGGTRSSGRQGFMLSGAYVLAMAATYAVFGVIAGSFSFNLQAASQAPWVITLFSAVFVVLALSMFGFFELQLPEAIRHRLGAHGANHKGGSLRGAAVMGALSALIVGPCVAPPLAAALLYISQTGDAVLGALALFVMGLGLGVPLLLLGFSEGSLLPRAGAWMERVKHVFGVLMLGVAIWFMGRVLPGPVTLVLWALLFILSAVWMGALEPARDSTGGRFAKGLGLAMLVYGATLIVGAMSGADDALRPLAPLAGSTTGGRVDRLPFTTIVSREELDVELERAGRAGRPVMLDFYADWCVTCKEMERDTFSDAGVRTLLAQAVLLQADVTDYDSDSRALLDHFNLYGPPAILFFDAAGKERGEHRLLGFVPADRFAAHLRAALRP